MVLTLKWNLLLFEDAMSYHHRICLTKCVFVTGFRIVNCKLCIDYFVVLRCVVATFILNCLLCTIDCLGHPRFYRIHL